MTIPAIRKVLTALALTLAPILVDPGHGQVPTVPCRRCRALPFGQPSTEYSMHSRLIHWSG